MLDNEVDDRIRAAFEELTAAPTSAEGDPVAAVRMRVSRRRRRRRSVRGGALVAVLCFALVAGIATTGGDEQGIEAAGMDAGAERDGVGMDVDRRGDGAVPVDEEWVLSKGEFESETLELVVATSSGDVDEVSGYCIGFAGGEYGGCDVDPDPSEFGAVLWDGSPPYVAFQVPVGIAAVRITWEDGRAERARVVRPVSDDALGFAAAMMPRTYADFSFVGLDEDGTPVGAVRQRPAVLGGPGDTVPERWLVPWSDDAATTPMPDGPAVDHVYTPMQRDPLDPASPFAQAVDELAVQRGWKPWVRSSDPNDDGTVTERAAFHLADGRALLFTSEQRRTPLAFPFMDRASFDEAHRAEAGYEVLDVQASDLFGQLFMASPDGTVLQVALDRPLIDGVPDHDFVPVDPTLAYVDLEALASSVLQRMA